MNKARVLEPMIIRDQMTMSRFVVLFVPCNGLVMLKLFLTASGTSFVFATRFRDRCLGLRAALYDEADT